MEYNFKVGDRVKIKGDVTDFTDHLDGKLGTIMIIHENDSLVGIDDDLAWYIWNWNMTPVCEGSEAPKEEVEEPKEEATPDPKADVKAKTPFEFNGFGKAYYYIDHSCRVMCTDDQRMFVDNNRQNVANYCKDEKLMLERAKEEALNRLLWRYSMEHDGDKVNWNTTEPKYRIYYDYVDKIYDVDTNAFFKNNGMVYFYSKEIAEKAIKEVIIPFNKGKLPCCRMWED